MVDGSVTLIKNAVCGTIIDPDRLLLGAEEGLFCVDLDNCGEYCAGDVELCRNRNKTKEELKMDITNH